MHFIVIFFGIESKSKQGFDKCDMHIVTIVESTTIVLSNFNFQLELVPPFFQINSIKKFKNYIQNWNFASITIVVINVKGIQDNKDEKQLMLGIKEG
jgi:hypothetical protein